MITESDFYNLDALESKINDAYKELQLKVQLESITQLLIQKGIFTENDLEATTVYLLNTKKWSSAFNEIKEFNSKLKYYQTHQQEYLQLLLKLKMEGKIK